MIEQDLRNRPERILKSIESSIRTKRPEREKKATSDYTNSCSFHIDKKPSYQIEMRHLSFLAH